MGEDGDIKRKPERPKRRQRKTEGDWDEWQRLEGNNHRDRLSKEQCLKILHIPSISFTALTVRDFVSCRMRLPSNVAHKDSFDHIWQSVPLSLSPPIPLPSALYATRFSMSLTHCSLIKHLVPLSFYHLSPHISLSRQFTPSTSLSHIHHLGCFGFPPPQLLLPLRPSLASLCGSLSLPLCVNSIWLNSRCFTESNVWWKVSPEAHNRLK